MLLLDGFPSRSSSRFFYAGVFTFINDLPDNLASNLKLFADDMSLFSTVTDSNITANHIKNDLHNISTWAHQREMNFNPDIVNKQKRSYLAE